MANNFLEHLKLNAKKIDEEIIAVFAKYGVDVTGRNARIDETSGTYKFNIAWATPQASEVRNRRSETTFKYFAEANGMRAEWFGKKFKAGTRTYTITGYNLRKKSRPVELLGADGKTYFAAPATVVSGMNSNPVV